MKKGFRPDDTSRMFRSTDSRSAASCAVESYADDICDDLEKSCAHRLTSRFSCGYGDLPLALQREIFPALQVTKHIGVTLTEGDLMMPTKSVTAIVGIIQSHI